MENDLDRRSILRRAMIASGALLLGGCDRLTGSAAAYRKISTAEDINFFIQRLLLTPASLAPEFSEADISKAFRANGSTDPDDLIYKRLAAGNFADYRLRIDGLVKNPASLSLPELRALPGRTHITRHDCVEGWSAIGKWKGVPLSVILEQVGLLPDARYVIFHCADALGGDQTKYYESIDMVDAFHRQTILAYEMNDQVLAIPQGAPLRLRLERQLGYKMAKYIMRIEVAKSFASIGKGNGGYWEDLGYEWYAGI